MTLSSLLRDSELASKTSRLIYDAEMKGWGLVLPVELSVGGASADKGGRTGAGSSAGAASCDSSVSSGSSADALKPLSGVSELCGLCLLTLNPMFIFLVSVVTAGSSSFAFVSYRNSAGALISVHKQRFALGRSNPEYCKLF